MANVKVAVSPLVCEKVVLRTVVDAVRPGVGTESRQALAESPSELQLQRAVIGGQAVLEKKETARIGIADSRPVIFIFLGQSGAVRGDIGNAERLELTQSLVDGRVPLRCVGKLQMP